MRRLSLNFTLAVAFVAAAFALLGNRADAQRLSQVPPPPGIEIATFAGGCFWCTEVDFDKLEGVTATISGFMGGSVPNPTYRQVVNGGTGHFEVVRVWYDPKKVSYERLVEYFVRTIDVTDAGGQFCDRGDMYRSAIFAHTPEQRAVAEKELKAIAGRFKQPIATELREATAFTQAEDYHQDFYKKDPGRYFSYRAGCGRDARIKALWGDEAFGAAKKTVN
ncbi:MAG: Peptide methionine sulfoxide reductase MsrA [Pseudomonadota bacterium]|jgi:peptide-methionine (S)-S-oxide reductase